MTLARQYYALLKYSALCARPPHEVIGFGFSLLAYKPADLVADSFAAMLFELEKRLEREYTALAPFPALHAVLLPLRTRLALMVRDVMEDPRTQEMYGSVVDLNRITGDTKLRDYFRGGETAEDQVGRWSAAVKKSVLSAIRRTDRGVLLERLRDGNEE